MTQNAETVLMIGATSSIAQAICRVLAAQGYSLVLAGRDETELNLLGADLATRFGGHHQTILVDLLHPHFAADDFIRHVGEFDHLMLAVGDMGSEDKDNLANIEMVTRINYILPAQIATAASAHLALRARGSIVLISSVAGDRGRQSNYVYGSAKAALSAFASGLRNRLYKQHVHVMTVKPGFVDTPMTWGMKSPLIASREYVAEHIIAKWQARADVVYVPFFWRYIMLIIQHIPERIFKRLSL